MSPEILGFILFFLVTILAIATTLITWFLITQIKKNRAYMKYAKEFHSEGR